MMVPFCLKILLFKYLSFTQKAQIWKACQDGGNNNGNKKKTCLWSFQGSGGANGQPDAGRAGVQHKLTMVALVLSWCSERRRAAVSSKRLRVFEGNLQGEEAHQIFLFFLLIFYAVSRQMRAPAYPADLDLMSRAPGAALTSLSTVRVEINGRQKLCPYCHCCSFSYEILHQPQLNCILAIS